VKAPRVGISEQAPQRLLQGGLLELHNPGMNPHRIHREDERMMAIDLGHRTAAKLAAAARARDEHHLRHSLWLAAPRESVEQHRCIGASRYARRLLPPASGNQRDDGCGACPELHGDLIK
jgi:hypothetical protein